MVNDFISDPYTLEKIYRKYMGQDVRITTPAPYGYVIYPVRILGIGAKLDINNKETMHVILRDGNIINVPVGTMVDEWKNG